MPGWTIRPPSILAKGFLIFADMSTLQNYSYCSQDKGLVDGKNLPSRGAQWLLQKNNLYFSIRDCHKSLY